MADIPDKLTTVVNYWPKQPIFSSPPTNTERNIGKRPIYKLDKVKQLEPSVLVLATKNSKRDVAEKLNWDIQNVHDAISSLEIPRHFHKALWCQASSSKWIPCDAYSIRGYRDSQSDWPIDLYLKFAISVTGSALLIVSCHL